MVARDLTSNFNSSPEAQAPLPGGLSSTVQFQLQRVHQHTCATECARCVTPRTTQIAEVRPSPALVPRRPRQPDGDEDAWEHCEAGAGAALFYAGAAILLATARRTGCAVLTASPAQDAVVSAAKKAEKEVVDKVVTPVAAAVKRGPGRPPKTPITGTPAAPEPSVIRTRAGARTPAH